ncbi:MAG: PadR family transcriptional regulator [Marinilabiliales bacterium]|nr:PadR family transcriptional regulator [Marinilabiliales bacterium]
MPVDIINELKKAEVIVVEGTLYPLLTRQKNAGSAQLPLGRIATGPPRKYYELTELGKDLSQ